MKHSKADREDRIDVAVVLEASTCDDWREALVGRLGMSQRTVSFTCFVMPSSQPTQSTQAIGITPHWSLNAYAALDRLLRRRSRHHLPKRTPAASAPHDARPLSEANATLALGGKDYVIYLGDDEPPAWIVNSPREGTLLFRSNDAGLFARRVPWLTDLGAGAPTIPFRIHLLEPTLERTTVRRGDIAMRSLSPTANATALVLRSADLLILELERSRSRSPRPRSDDVTSVPSPIAASLHVSGGASAVSLLLRRRAASREQGRSRWHLGYERISRAHPAAEGPPGALLELLPRANTLTPPDGVLWADPFPVEDSGNTLIFFEAQRGSEPGIIQVAELLADGRFREPTTVLSTGSHLSYPNVFKWEGEWWMIPESAEAGELVLYRAVEFPTRWARERVLLRDVQVVDPTPWQHDGKWWLFAGRVGPDLHPHEDLLLYSADHLTGDWHPHPLNPIVSNVTAARPAGAMLRRSGKWYRPAQDCSIRYGYGLSLLEVLTITDSIYEERLEASASPAQCSPAVLGLHTLNVSESLVVTDFLLQE